MRKMGNILRLEPAAGPGSRTPRPQFPSFQEGWHEVPGCFEPVTGHPPAGFWGREARFSNPCCFMEGGNAESEANGVTHKTCRVFSNPRCSMEGGNAESAANGVTHKTRRRSSNPPRVMEGGNAESEANGVTHIRPVRPKDPATNSQPRGRFYASLHYVCEKKKRILEHEKVSKRTPFRPCEA